MNRSEDIVRQYGQSVFTIICQLVGNVQDAEELTQDTLLRGLNQMDSYDPERHRCALGSAASLTAQP